MRTIICVLTGLLLIASSLDSPVFALFGDGAAAESAAPAAGIHPAPRTIHMNGRIAEFANPALVVPIDLAGTLAAERMKQALAEFGIADIPVLSEDAPIFKHDCVFYIGMHYPRCPTLASMRKRGFGDAPDRNRRQAYVLMTAPIDVERALPAQVFLLANSMPAMHSAIESLRQTLANYNPDVRELPLKIGELTVVDEPSWESRGVAMEIADADELQQALRALASMKINRFVDLYAPAQWDKAAEARVRSGMTLAQSLGIEYIPCAPGIMSLFSSAEALALDGQMKRVERLVSLGAKDVILLENSQEQPSQRGVPNGGQYNHADQHLASYRAALTAAKRADYDARVHFWGKVDFGAPQAENLPLNWYLRDRQDEAREYLRRIQAGLPPEARIVWRGATAEPTLGRTIESDASQALPRRDLYYLVDEADWQASGFQPFMLEEAIPSNCDGAIMYLHGATTLEAITLPTLATAAEWMWNSDGYKPSDAAMNAALMRLSGAQAHAMLHFAEGYIRPYSHPGEFLDGAKVSTAAVRKSVSGEPARAAIMETIRSLQMELSETLKNDSYFRTELLRAMDAFTQEFDPASLINRIESGSLEDRLDAARSLSLVSDGFNWQAAEPLIQMSNLQVNLAAAGALLKNTGSPEAFALIEENLTNETAPIRNIALMQLGFDPEKREQELLLEIWKDDMAPVEQRLSAAYALALRGNKKAFRFFVQQTYEGNLRPWEFERALSSMQWLTGVSLPVPYINSGLSSKAYRKMQ